jgi:two-component system, OmpR family, alkaline phosphatase synthesis response regulator PhoP
MESEKKRILIVDDDPDFSGSVAYFLEEGGYSVRKAPNGAEALRLAALERPDLILMDIMMGERTEGFFTVQQFRRIPELRTIPIFVVTALYSQLPEFSVAPDSAWLGHDEFFQKPVNMPDLLEHIRKRLLEKRAVPAAAAKGVIA